ncbi:hypothetical protein GOBAR_AA15124 [Gossypium barbadense]|uniref:Uncharacterized protein n=1 Tax=Gossypium barbadense TaxID=3634 RepID=A0A2P5XQA5_GOSBA|nr:hypothetical protein GOBAR_AA15124 [Gossypium barbadense]
MECRYLKDGGRANALEQLGSPSAIPNSSTINWRTRPTKAELEHSRIVEVGHDGLKMKRRVELQSELEIRRLDDLKEKPPRVNR